MGRFTDWLYGRDIEVRALGTSGLAMPQQFLVDALGARPAASGQRVTVEKALGASPVYAATSIIAEQVGQLPLKVYRDMDDNRVEARTHRMWYRLHDKPNAHTPADRFWSAVSAQVLLWGNCFIRKTRDPNGLVDELILLDPSLVTVQWNPETQTKQFRYMAQFGQPGVMLDDYDILHIFGFTTDGLVGRSVIQTCRDPLGTAIARQRFEGGFYNRGTSVSGIIEHPDRISESAAKNLSESFKVLYSGAERAHGTPVLEEGATFKPVSMPLADLQFVESQQLSRTDIAVLFKLPPTYLGGSSGHSLTYATVQSNRTDFALHTIAPITNTIGSALTADPSVFPQSSYTAEFDLRAMMNGDASERVAYYTAMNKLQRRDGEPALSIDEIRQAEGLAPLPAEKEPQVPPQLSPPDQQNGQPPNGSPTPEQMAALVAANGGSHQ